MRTSRLRVLSPPGELCFGPVLQPAAPGLPTAAPARRVPAQPLQAGCPQPLPGAHPVAPSALSPADGTRSEVPQPRVGLSAVPPPAALAPMPRSAVTPSSCSRFGRTRCRKREVSTLGALFLGRNSRLNADKSQQDGCGEGVRGRGKEAVPCSSSPLCPAQPEPAPSGLLHPCPAAPPAPAHGDGATIGTASTKRSRSPAKGCQPRPCAG